MEHIISMIQSIMQPNSYKQQWRIKGEVIGLQPEAPNP